MTSGFSQSVYVLPVNIVWVSDYFSGSSDDVGMISVMFAMSSVLSVWSLSECIISAGWTVNCLPSFQFLYLTAQNLY